MSTPMTWPGCGAKFVRDNSAEDKTMTEQEGLRVLRNELAIIIGCDDGRSAQEKAGAVIAWIDKHDRRATIQPVAAPEPVQQAHVMPPFAAPAGQHDADERAFDTLHGAVMNLPCKPGRAIAMNGASKQAYQEGHRDARHAAADLIAESSSGFREARNTSPESNLAAPAQAATDWVRGVLTEAQKNTIRFAAEALDGLDYEDTAGDLRDILRTTSTGGA